MMVERPVRRVLLLVAVLVSIAGCKHHGPNTEAALVKVYQSDGSVQCQSGYGNSVAAMQAELTAAGIDVLCGQKGSTGAMYPAVCGGATGAINIYTIHAQNMEAAAKLGFDAVSALPDYRDQPCGR